MMLKRIAIVIFILSSLAFTACKEEQQAKPQKEISEVEREAATQKALETNFQKSSGKVWNP